MEILFSQSEILLHESLFPLRAVYDIPTIIIGIFLNLIVVYVVLRNLFRVEKILGVAGISILRKVFGIVLLAISIKLFRTNVGF